MNATSGLNAKDVAMTLLATINKIQAKLPELLAIDLGYPLGDNFVRKANRPNGLPASFLSRNGTRWLTELYLACDGLQLPDVHSGYFLEPLDRVLLCDVPSVPDTIAGENEIAVIPFGSTGDGSLLVVGCDEGNVLMLLPGLIRAGQYDGRTGTVLEAAATVPEFLERLFDDLVAFINDDREHSYIASAR